MTKRYSKALGFFLIGCVIVAMMNRRRRPKIVVRTNGGKSLRICTSARLSPAERKEDIALQRAVSSKTREQLRQGIPVARYDAVKKAVYLEYPDGRIQYKS